MYVLVIVLLKIDAMETSVRGNHMLRLCISLRVRGRSLCCLLSSVQSDTVYKTA